MISAAIFDYDDYNYKKIRELFVKYTICENVDIDILHFSADSTEEKIRNYVANISFALVSLDMENGEKIGNLIYNCNTDCRILYYRKEKGELEHLLSSRPIAYHELRYDEKILFDKIKYIISEISNAVNTLSYETKRSKYFFTYKEILYLQSDLKYVNIYKTNGKKEMIYTKLSEIEKLLGHGFVRIHKSYIANRSYIENIDKKTHAVIMKNGDTLPISDAQYKNVIEKLS